MKNYLTDAVTGNTELAVFYEKDTQKCSNKTFPAMRRFYKAAKRLPQGEVFGIQISTGKEHRADILASDGVKITGKDYSWMFSGYGIVKENTTRPGAKESKRAYVLYREHDENNKFEEPEESWLADLGEGRELLLNLEENGITVRIIAGADMVTGGKIVFLMDDEMPFRVRSMIAFAFQGSGVKEAEEVNGEMVLPEAAFSLYAATIMTLYMELCGEEKMHDPAIPVEIKKLPLKAAEMTLDELELSVRAYNCLKRAGVNTLEEIYEMSYDDLKNIRNLGPECFLEIRTKAENVIRHILAEKDTGEDAKKNPKTESQKDSKKDILKDSDKKSEKETAVATENIGDPEPEFKAQNELNELAGLQNVKEQIGKIVAFAKMRKDMESKGMPIGSFAMNMNFQGNPGTAKTTVARILAKLLHEVGILKAGEIVEVGRADLIARYQGQTADKVKHVFDVAKGKLLFIDEAYSLVEDSGSYGDEAITTIVQEMENRRSETIVVFAGYPDRMKEFFNQNPGLRSRVPFHLDFEDYSAEEMMEIVTREVARHSFRLSADAYKRAYRICRETSQMEDSGNGRFCRNLVEAAILNYADRVYGSGRETESDSEKGHFVLHGIDFSAPKTAEKESHGIGFRAS